MAKVVLSKEALCDPLTTPVGFGLGVMMVMFIAGMPGKLTATHHVQSSSWELGERNQTMVQVQWDSEVLVWRVQGLVEQWIVILWDSSFQITFCFLCVSHMAEHQSVSCTVL